MWMEMPMHVWRTGFEFDGINSGSLYRVKVREKLVVVV